MFSGANDTCCREGYSKPRELLPRSLSLKARGTRGQFGKQSWYEFFLVSQGLKTAQSSSCRFREMEQEDRRKNWWLKGGPQSSEGS